jgi:hypothetical protein
MKMQIGSASTPVLMTPRDTLAPSSSSEANTPGGSSPATPVNEMRHLMEMEIDSLASNLGALNWSKWALANLDFLLEDGTRQVGAERAAVAVAGIKEQAERQIKFMDERLTALPSRLAETYSISGNLVAKDSNGDWTLGEFSITGTGRDQGRPFSVTLDSRTGFSITAGGTTTTDPAAAAAIALLRDGISDGGRLIDQRV